MTTIARNTALIPLPAADRLFGWRDHAALWLSLGVGLLVMQVGAYLVPAPRLTVLTHMGHELDYDALSAELPEGITPAYDGMELRLEDPAT